MARALVPHILLAIILIQLSFASAIQCNGQQCIGPVFVKFPMQNCDGIPSYEPILPSYIANGDQGSCINLFGENERQSARWACSKMGLDTASYSAPGCDLGSYQVPFKTQTYNVDRCFNVGSTSVALSCSNSTAPGGVSLQPQVGITANGPLLGEPFKPCPAGKCPPNVPYVASYRSANCFGQSLQASALFENTQASSSTCYIATNTSDTLPLLSVRFGCTRTEIFAKYYSSDCLTGSESVRPVFTTSYPLMNACIYDEVSRSYFKYFC